MRVEKIGDAELFNGDCMEIMKQYPDKYFQLACVDPPYGIGDFSPNSGSRGTSCKGKEWDIKWNDHTPERKYFDEVIRVSENQIIWGSNYYNCFSKDGGCLVWHKGNINPVFSQCEIASLSFQKRVDYVHIDWQAGFARRKEGETIHPCQKPIALYKWILSHYAKPGDRILDTHGGSGSSVIACLDMGFPMVWIEKDADYYEAALKRIKVFASQPKLIENDRPAMRQVDLIET